MPPLRFGARFAVWIAHRGVSYAEFARIVNCSKGWPANIASGRQRPPDSIEQLTKWASVLRLNATEKDEFIELALLEHAPDLIRERYGAMKSALQSGGR